MAKLARFKQIEILEKQGKVRVYHLRNINDGSLLDILDEGPLETNPNFMNLDPTGTRQQLVKMLRKVDSNDGTPIFWADKPGQPPVFDHASKQYISIPVLTKEAIAKMKENLKRRDEANATAKRMLNAAKQHAEEVMSKAGADMVNAPVGTVADAIAAQNAAATPGGDGGGIA